MRRRAVITFFFVASLWLSAAAVAATPTVSIDGDTVIALRIDGTAFAWGSNTFRQIGDGTDSHRASPVPVLALSDVRGVHSRGVESWAWLADGSVYAWGGLRPATPTRHSLTNVLAMTEGHRTGVLFREGSVCTGMEPCSPVSGLPRIVALAGGQLSHLLALAADGTVWAWGNNDKGQLGDGTTINRSAPVQVAGLANVVAIAAARDFSLALKTDGTVWAWGQGEQGEMGDGSGMNRTTAGQVPGLAGVIAIGAVFARGIAVKSDGTLWEWGQPAFGGFRSAPTAVPGVSNVVGVWGGGNGPATFVMKADGTLLSYGRANTYGQLGYGEFGDTPVTLRTVLSLNLLGGAAANAPPQATFSMEVTPAAGFAARCDASGSADPDGRIVAYEWLASNGVTATGPTATFAFSAFAPHSVQLTVRDDRGATSTVQAAVLPPRATPGQARIAMTQTHSYQVHGLRNDGVLFSWGSNSTGQLGSGTVFDRTVPVRVALLNAVKEVAAGRHFSVALRDDGTVWAWGSNLWGQLGDGSSAGRSAIPVQVLGLSAVAAVAAGYSGALAIRSDGTVWEWGGVGSPFDIVRSPRQVPGLSGATAAVFSSVGEWHVLKVDGTLWSYRGGSAPVQLAIQNVVAISAGLAVRADGSLWATSGRDPENFGLPASTPTPYPPTQIPGLADVAAVAASSSNIVLKRDGTVWEFGGWQRRALARIEGLDGIVQVTAADAAFAALRSDGVVFTRGFNDAAMLGDGTYIDRDAPVVVLSEDGLGSLDGNDWYLDLVPTSSLPIAVSQVPTALAFASRRGGGGSSIDAVIRYRQRDFGRRVSNFVLGVVPESFLGMVPLAPGTAPPASPKSDTLVYVQLTPSGWARVGGALIAYSHAAASAQGSSARLLDNVPLPAGYRFCVGYGSSAEEMIRNASLRDLLADRGAVSREGCFFPGVYLEGPAESVASTPVRFAAHVIAFSPTGTVQFRDGAADLGTPQALTVMTEALSSAQLTTSTLAAGAHQIGAQYTGNNPAMSSATPLTHTVVNAVRVTLGGPASSQLGQQVALLATVAGNNPDGTVAFRDGSTTLATQPVIAGAATLYLDSLAAGAHSLTAVYSGDARNPSASSSALAHTVTVPATITVALTASPTQAAAGTTVTFTASVSGPATSGSMELRGDDNALLGSARLQNGSATLALDALAPRTHFIKARYLDDAGTVRAISQAIAVTVTGEAGLAVAPQALVFGAQDVNTVSATQTVTIANTGFAPLSITSLSASSGFAATHNCGTLEAAASCAAQVSFRPTGQGSVNGTLTVASSAGTRVAQLSGTGTLVPVTVTLSSSGNPSILGNGVTFTASLGATAPVPAGTITFRDGAAAMCSPVPLSSGQAQCATSSLSASTHSITAEYSGDSTYAAGTSAALSQVVYASSSAVPRVANISTRMAVLTGDNVLIGGFIIGGSTAKTVVVRARGPSLAAAGVPNVLVNPVLNLYSGPTVIASNDDWQTAANAATIQSSGFEPLDSRESAILMTLGPGAYTAIVQGVGGTTGVGIVEVFEVDNFPTPLINIATRGAVLTGDNVMIAGFIIHGSGPRTVVVRARGPSLTAFGVPNVLANPLLSLFSGQAIIVANDDWVNASNAATIQSSGFAPADARESAIYLTLNPGAYTAIVEGAGGTTGVAIVEVFVVP